MKYLKKFNENNRRFVGPDGEFASTFKKDPGKINIGYLEELLEWLYYHDNIDNDEKLEKILSIELVISNLLNESGMFKGGVNYIPTWSVKLKKDMGI
jgi:hypothetical protein